MSRFTLGVCLVVFAGAVVYFLTYPQWQSLQSLNKEIESLGELNQELTALIEKRDALLQLRQSISQVDLDRLAQLAPEDPDGKSLLVDLEALSRQNGMVLQKFDMLEAPTLRPSGGVAMATGPFAEDEVVIQVQGVYSSFRSFLTGLEKNLRLVDVDSISFVEADGPLNFDIKGTAYHRQ